MPMEQEGTKSVVRAWLKKVGDAVKRDEPLVELETDKVAVEVPAPADGVLTSIALGEGEEAAPGAVLGALSSSAVPGRPQAEPATPCADVAFYVPVCSEFARPAMRERTKRASRRSCAVCLPTTNSTPAPSPAAAAMGASRMTMWKRI